MQSANLDVFQRGEDSPTPWHAREESRFPVDFKRSNGRGNQYSTIANLAKNVTSHLRVCLLELCTDRGSHIVVLERECISCSMAHVRKDHHSKDGSCEESSWEASFSLSACAAHFASLLAPGVFSSSVLWTCMWTVFGPSEQARPQRKAKSC